MRIVMFYHSLVSDWNHGNAHFLRGVVSELIDRRHHVDVYEPADGWSRNQLVRFHGGQAEQWYRQEYPRLTSTRYDATDLDFEQLVGNYDLVIVHEWNDPQVVARIGQAVSRRRTAGQPSPRLLFHDTHHRSVSRPEEINAYELQHYDGVLAFGRVIRDWYLRHGRVENAWTWHEAADTRVFHPRPIREMEGDIVWIGNWGDDERTAELHEFLIEPIRRLNLRAAVYGVRYPEQARRLLDDRGIAYRGYLPNHNVPKVFARYRLTVHIPRRPYATILPGIPTIRPFEALACGIPLISAPWNDSENLFDVGNDFLMVRNGEEMAAAMDRLLGDRSLHEHLRHRGPRAIHERHACRHRVDRLLAIDRKLRDGTPEVRAASSRPRPFIATPSFTE